MPARRILAAVVSISLAASPVCAATRLGAPAIGGGRNAALSSRPSLPALPALPLGLAPSALAPVAAAASARTLAPASPAAALLAISQAAAPAAAGPIEPARLDEAWDRRMAPARAEPVVPALSSEASAAAAAVPSVLSASAPRSARSIPSYRRAASAALAPFAAAQTPSWLHGAASWLSPYLIGAGIIGGSWMLQRLSRWAIDRMAKSGGWNANTTDTARFIASLSSWLLGAGVGLSMAGTSTMTILTTFSVLVTLAVRKTVGNLVQAVLILVNRPFVIGEKVRIGETLYQVRDMELQYVKLRVLGRLVKDAPDSGKLEAGVSVKPLSAVDPLGRAVDERGNKFVLVRELKPNALPAEAAVEMATFKYSQLSDKSITLFRPYVPDYKKLEASRIKSALDGAKNPIGKTWEAVRQMPRGALLKSASWMIGAIVLVPAAPMLKGWIAWKFAASIVTYLHAASIVAATKYTAAFAARLIPLLFKKFGRSHQAAVVARLLIQIAFWCVGLSLTMRVIGLHWGDVIASLGLTAAAMTVATTDVLNNFAQAGLLRLNRPFNIGDTVRIGADTGVVESMGMFYVVVRTAEGLHTMVPYGVIDASDLGTYVLETK